MRIFVPSCGRHDRVSSGVVRFASPAMRWQMLFVVPPEEESQYRAALPDDVRLITCPERGIAATRRWIGELAFSRGDEKFLMCDDDIWFYNRVSYDRVNLVYCEPELVDEMLSEVERNLDDYAHVAVSAREGNNRAGLGDPKSCVRENTRTLRALAYRTEDFLSVEHERVDVMEDFDVNLQLLRKGRPNLELCYWAQGQRQTGEAGGCSGYRTHQLHEESARQLAVLHPQFVSLREKRNKTGGAFGTRTEVTIQWKRAYQSGVLWNRRGSP